MSALQQTVEITASRRILLDVPADIPEGLAQMTVIFSPLARTRKSITDYAGTLADCDEFAGDSVELQRAWRDEW